MRYTGPALGNILVRIKIGLLSLQSVTLLPIMIDPASCTHGQKKLFFRLLIFLRSLCPFPSKNKAILEISVLAMVRLRIWNEVIPPRYVSERLVLPV